MDRLWFVLPPPQQIWVTGLLCFHGRKIMSILYEYLQSSKSSSEFFGFFVFLLKRPMMAYGLGRNIALLPIFQSFILTTSRPTH